MPGPIGEKNVSYPFLNRFSTKTLRQLLQEDFASKEPSTPESDTFITCVAEVVARREAANPNIPRFDVEAGWKNFLKGYCPEGPDAAGALAADITRMAAQWTHLQGGEQEDQPET